MEYTLQNLDEIRIGSIVAEDLFVNTKYPIMRKDTRLTREHLEVLRAFNVTKVPVSIENIFNRSEEEILELNNKERVIVEKNNSLPLNKTNFKTLYNESVSNFYKEFSSWEAGVKVDVAKLRHIVMPLIDRAMQEKQIFSLLNSYSSIDKYIAHHSLAVGMLSGAIARKLQYTSGQINQIATAGLLADVGMAKIDQKIREKKTPLTENEFSEIKKHTIFSFQAIKDSPLLKPETKLGIFQHHERLDGSGYPKGEKMENISLVAQIIAVADVYHAMTSERIYRARASSFKVLEMIKEEEFGKYNIEAVNALISLVCDLPISTRVRLSDGELGEIIFIHRDSPMRPMIRLSETGQILDLAAKRSLHIESIID
ncbi:HD-GYP domain-containing protein [Psychrobacillus sp. NPDC093200]|uniref:HD-GYP domain-containing protein n=1 Tax=Psychrobacillus sp. NPDC093200 TaxID=3390656 RepID=UPI0012B0E8D9|nr:HD domain-containing protein [Bacillus sp. N3536]